MELRETMNLSRASAKNVVRRALTKAAAPIESDAEARAPQLRGHLKQSFTTGTKLTRRQKSQHKKESEVEIFVGPGGLPQAHLQEFGSSVHGPQPFLRPAWDSNKMSALNNIGKELASEIDKAAKRLERKAARLAAKARAGI
jgi:HK97 gp10 family phage protein